MNQPVSTPGPSVPTWDLLRSLGFAEDQTLTSVLRPGLSFDFGNFKLRAISGANRNFVHVVLLCGVMVTERSIREVECEMPPEVESAEQGMAWIAWCLDNNAGRRKFEAAVTPAWLTEGRLHLDLLPWEREKAAYAAHGAAYAARPHCHVRRDWARVALKMLGELTTVDDEASVTFKFDGTVLTIRCAGKVSVMPADGRPWTQAYSIKAGALRTLPKRLKYTVEISVWGAVLTMGDRAYKPVLAIEVGEGR